MQWSSHDSTKEEKKAIAVSVLGLCSADARPHIISVLFEMTSRTEGDSVV